MKRDVHLRIYPAPAKINLGLEILHKRSDGYHELNTIFYRVWEPHDVIAVHPSEAFVLTTSDTSLKTDRTNLIFKAAQAFAEATSESNLPPFSFHIDKHIPMGAGLGGGSSNAATTLLILNELMPNPISPERLLRLGASLGADIPFFLTQSTSALASGIGDVLSPLSVQLPVYILIVKPHSIAVPTKEAYEYLKLNMREPTDLVAVMDGDLNDLPKKLHNDFEAYAFGLHPSLKNIKEQLYAEGAFYASMSGSGSALYGMFESEEDVKAAQRVMQKAGHAVYLNEPANAQF